MDLKFRAETNSLVSHQLITNYRPLKINSNFVNNFTCLHYFRARVMTREMEISKRKSANCTSSTTDLSKLCGSYNSDCYNA